MKIDKHKQLTKVQHQFEDQIDYYTSEEVEAKKSEVIPFLEEFFRNSGKRRQKKIKICEFGGGNGILLREIAAKLGESNVDLYNIELTASYGNNLAHKSINFINGSVLNDSLSENQYDVVILRAVLHHLVGRKKSITMKNQKKAIKNLFKVVKPGGLVILDEQVNDNRLASGIIYYLSRLAARLGFRWKRFQITPNTIIYFWSQKMIRDEFLKHIDTASVIHSNYTKWNLPWYWKSTLLMNNVGWLFLVVKK